MVIEVKALPWDTFLNEGSRIQVEGFRKTVWPSIRRDLSRANVNWPEGLEPCWVEVGKAAYFREEFTSTRVTKTDDSGREYRAMEEVTYGWQKTVLPSNNATIIGNYLRKGFRLRPPGREAVEAEAAVPSEAPAELKEEFVCYRHGYGKRVMKTWKGYVNHCVHYNEHTEASVPVSVMQRAVNFNFYCMQHNAGFDTETSMKRHISNEERRSAKKKHLPLEATRVNKDKVEE